MKRAKELDYDVHCNLVAILGKSKKGAGRKVHPEKAIDERKTRVMCSTALRRAACTFTATPPGGMTKPQIRKW